MQNEFHSKNQNSESFDLQSFLPEMLERLADGELSEEERRLVLSRLDEIQNGWRDCAMAFLENVMVQESLTGKTDQAGETNTWDEVFSAERNPLAAEKTVSSVRHSVRTVFNKINFFAVCSGFLLAFCLGGLIFYLIVRTDTAIPGSFPPEHVITTVEPRDSRGAVPVPMPYIDPNEPYIPPILAESSLPDAPLQYVTLDSANPEFQGIQVPCYPAESVNPAAYLSTSPTFRDNEIQRLRAEGHDVDIQRQNIVVPVSDGRRAVIPVDQVNIRYRPRIRYQ
ncbi:MAG: hypothetical protein LBQ54_13925 [Planctomycetaceae bacterium]|jgi:hypothetical protein|nr:hypothetical protein [Planctomycetaceae bacterium]